MSGRVAIDLGGRSLLFFDCREIAPGGPEACLLELDGVPIPRWRFDPSPLAHDGAILVPARHAGTDEPGYALARIDWDSHRVEIVSEVRPYMKLLRAEGGSVAFATSSDGAETDTVDL